LIHANAGSARTSPGTRLNGDLVESGQIYNHTTVAARSAGLAVAPAADSDGQRTRTREIKTSRYIVSIGTTRNQKRMAIKYAIIRAPGRFVESVARYDEIAFEASAKWRQVQSLRRRGGNF
jgi:hypothetical protein